MSMSSFELPDQTVVLEHQIAGHRHEHGKLYTGTKILNFQLIKISQYNIHIFGSRYVEAY